MVTGDGEPRAAPAWPRSLRQQKTPTFNFSGVDFQVEAGSRRRNEAAVTRRGTWAGPGVDFYGAKRGKGCHGLFAASGREYTQNGKIRPTSGLPGALEGGLRGEEPRAGNDFSRTALKGWSSGLSPARPSLLQTRACRGAHNDNTSSISAWNDGRLDAIACHFCLVLVPHAV